MTRAFAPSLGTLEHDLSAIRSGDWSDRQFPLGQRERPTRRSVVFRQSVLNDIYEHGRGNTDIEVCGVLVGNVYTDAMGPFVFVEADIRGNHSAGRNSQVTFTAKTWSHIQDVMDREYPDLRILGWYHTHPGHGIFLSEMDLFIHKNFFSLPWHLAFVFDPQLQEEGLFAWRGGNMAIESFVVCRDEPPPQQRVARRVPDLPSMQTAPVLAAGARGQSEAVGLSGVTGRSIAAAAEVADLSGRLQTIEKRQRWMTVALALMVLVAVAWPIALSALSLMQSAEPEAPPPWILPDPTDETGEVGPSPAASPPAEADDPTSRPD